MKRHAWAIVPLLLLTGLLLALFGNFNDADGPELEVMRATAAMEWLALNPGTGREDLQAEFVSVGEKKRNQVLGRLAELRSIYRLLAPSLEVSAEPGSANRARLAQTLTQLLARHGLARRSDTAAPEPWLEASGPAVAQAPLIVRATEADRKVVHAFLRALAPLLSGDVLLVFEAQQTTGKITLHIQGEPRFDRDGMAVFERWSAAEAAAVFQRD